MSESLINALHAIGTPVVIIAAAAIAILMGQISHKLSVAGGIITLVSVAFYIPIDLIPRARDAWGDTTISVSPASFQAYLNDMSPTDVTVVAKRGEEELAKTTIAANSAAKSGKNELQLERNGKDESFVAKVGSTEIGVVTDKELESKGFYRNSAVSSQPQYIASSKRVYAGGSWSVNNTPLGKLELHFIKIDGDNVVLKLVSSNYGTPQPEVIAISNKQFDIQSFEGKYEVTIQVREANFNVSGGEWAAFTIIVT